MPQAAGAWRCSTAAAANCSGAATRSSIFAITTSRWPPAKCSASTASPRRNAQSLARRGVELPGKGTLYSLDARSGEVVWSAQDDVFGTFLNYSPKHDILLQAGSKYRDRAKDESGDRMVAYRGATGKVLWSRDVSHGGPCMLWRDEILTNGGGGFALDIATGEPTGWKYYRMYGCNTAIGCQTLLTFRSGAAGVFDLANDSGTGNLGGFRSSCTNNLIPANGVLNAPDYTRTCTCAYQNQTSLALVHMPEAEFWTFGATGGAGRIGLNFARRATGETPTARSGSIFPASVDSRKPFRPRSSPGPPKHSAATPA